MNYMPYPYFYLSLAFYFSPFKARYVFVVQKCLIKGALFYFSTPLYFGNSLLTDT
ncbi:MAG: hypothetical protein JWR05_966 [Mucilaginibacter sp.]|nr:hypothetical protein [Mucilaginibacter sp.]